MSFIRIYGLFLRHFLFNYQIFSKNFRFNLLAINSNNFVGIYFKFFCIYIAHYYNNAVGVILTCAILYDFLFRTSIGFNMLFLEEIWSRNFTNLFIAPIKIGEIIISLVFTALIRALIGLGSCNITYISSFWNIFIRSWNAFIFSFFKFIYIWNYFRNICFCRIIKIWSFF